MTVTPPEGPTVAARTLPGPRLPAALQSLLLGLPVGRRIDWSPPWGDRFRLEMWTPRGRADAGRAPLVRATVVVVSAPADLRALFSAPAHALSTGDARGFVEWWVGRDSILVLDGPQHERERQFLHKLLTPQLLEDCDGAATEAAGAVLDRLPARGRIRLGPLIDELVLHASVRVLFGNTREDLVRCMTEFTHSTIYAPLWAGPTLFIPALRRLGVFWPTVRRAAAAEAHLRDVIAAEVAARDRPRRFRDADLMTRLLELERVDAVAGGVAGEAGTPAAIRRYTRITTLFGGLDTLCATLRWCFLRLLANPAILRNATDAARAVAHEHHRVYLEAVCKEALRLDPPFLVAIRRACRDTVVGDIAVERGMYVAAAIRLAHRRPAVYPNPECFRPDRFLKRSFSAWEYMPFGGGARRCLGHAMALRQMTTLLSTILQRLDLSARGSYDTGAIRRSIMLLPRDALQADYARA